MSSSPQRSGHGGIAQMDYGRLKRVSETLPLCAPLSGMPVELKVRGPVFIDDGEPLRVVGRHHSGMATIRLRILHFPDLTGSK
jgi:hypothetical protein